jgi:hypothetical protein
LHDVKRAVGVAVAVGTAWAYPVEGRGDRAIIEALRDNHEHGADPVDT